MVFSSATFLFYFLPTFLLLYYILPWKNGILLAASLIFYAWGEPRFVPLLMVSALLNYSFGLLIGRARAHRLAWLWLGVAINLGLLAYYKYTGFLVSVWNQASGHGLALPAIVLPLGISFFTFQGLSYLIDVYRRDVDPQKSFWNFAMYKAMFPQLIAGPIVRYRQIAADMAERALPNARIAHGFRQFVTGLAQKVLIANTVALPADSLFGSGAGTLTVPSAWIALACYSIQILYDFAGYSNMAIGIGHMLGFTYPPNFRQPYAGTSVTDFWRRWHISLSSWFRDYVYIPLGGNRVAAWRTYLNLSLVFLLCGLWHGAAWTFIVWGAWHGALLVAERAGLGRLLARLPRSVGQLYMLLMVMLGWVWFRAADLPAALHFFAALFGQGHADAQAHPWQMDVGAAQWSALAVGAALAVWRRPDAWEKTSAQAAAPSSEPAPVWAMPARRQAVWLAVSCAAFIASAASLAGGTYNPFIYFRF